MKVAIILAIVSSVLLLFWYMTASGVKELGFNDVECAFMFSEHEKDAFSKITVVYKNKSKKPGSFVPPLPADEDDDEEPKTPWLGLLIKSKNGNDEEEFMLTLTDGKPEQKWMKLFLSAGESKSIEYQLSDFWRWGPCGPDRSGSFLNFISPGNSEAEAQVVLIKGDTNQQTLESKPVELRCTFSKPWVEGE